MHRNIIPLTHHFKIWYGAHLNEMVVNSLEMQHKFNPSHDMALFVNTTLLNNKDNEVFLTRLKENNIHVADINNVLNRRDLNETKLKYAINRMIEKGLAYLEIAKSMTKEKANAYNTMGYRCFAAASDVSRCLISLVEYKCPRDVYRVYSDADYYLFKIPNQVTGICLFGTSEEKIEDEFNRTKRSRNAGMDLNFIAIPPRHIWMEQIRKNWENSFALQDYRPTEYLSTSGHANTDELSLDDTTVISKTSTDLIDSYSMSPRPADYAYWDVALAISLSSYDEEKILIDRRLDEIIFINKQQGSWYGKKDKTFAGSITINELKPSGNIELTISSDAFSTHQSLPLLGKELLKFLILGNVIPDAKLKDLDDTTSDYQTIIPACKKTYFLEMITAFTRSYSITSIKGNLRDVILAFTSNVALESKSVTSHVSSTLTETPTELTEEAKTQLHPSVPRTLISTSSSTAISKQLQEHKEEHRIIVDNATTPFVSSPSTTSTETSAIKAPPPHRVIGAINDGSYSSPKRQRR